MMITSWDNEGNVNVNNMELWPQVRKRMMALVKKRCSKFQTLALGLAKYSYATSPEDWRGNDQEKFILRFANFVMAKKKRYESAIISIRQDFRKGLIPDALDLICDYCC